MLIHSENKPKKLFKYHALAESDTAAKNSLYIHDMVGKVVIYEVVNIVVYISHLQYGR